MKKSFLLFPLLFLVCASSFAGSDVKSPNVSGQFYPADSKELSQEVQKFLDAAKPDDLPQNIQIIISPHAGYVYSGPVAAYSYKAIQGRPYKTIVIIALSHFADFEGFALWPQGAFETPLGSVEVDEDFVKNLLQKTERIRILPEAFDREHSLETQLPFLQTVLKDFKIVPILTSQPNFNDCKILASALHEMIGERKDVLLVISTDMSHYHDGATASRMDEAALSDVANLQPENLWQGVAAREKEFCGFVGVTTALLYAQLRGIDGVRVLKHADSGDATGDHDRVVGYSSVIFYEKADKEGDKNMNKENNGAPPLTEMQKRRLIKIARGTIDAYVRKKEIPEFQESDPRLSSMEGAFVTIRKKGMLRGCIGNVIGTHPLYMTIRNMAVAAATQDPRFSPLGEEELNDIEVEVSVLSVPRQIKSIEEFQLGKHGAIVSRGSHNGLFLPQVAGETGWSKEEFFSYLCQEKAGLPADAWKDPETAIQIFTADVFSEKSIGP